MSELIIWTLDWVPEGPRGLVRDLRLRWACEEAGIPYRVATIPFEERETNHLPRQPFGQVPFLDDGELQLFESGAALLHIAQKSATLMPRDAAGAADTLQWVIAALNSIEIVTLPWWFQHINGEEDNGLTQWTGTRLQQLEDVLCERDWLAAGRFTAADLLMSDVLRLPAVRSLGDRPASEAYVQRVTSRPAFVKAYEDQIEHFRNADLARG